MQFHDEYALGYFSGFCYPIFCSTPRGRELTSSRGFFCQLDSINSLPEKESRKKILTAFLVKSFAPHVLI